MSKFAVSKSVVYAVYTCTGRRVTEYEFLSLAVVDCEGHPGRYWRQEDAA